MFVLEIIAVYYELIPNTYVVPIYKCKTNFFFLSNAIQLLHKKHSV